MLTYEQFKAEDARLRAIMAGVVYPEGSGSGPMGLTPDIVRLTPAWQLAHRTYHTANNAMHSLHRTHRPYSRAMQNESRKERDAKRAAIQAKTDLSPVAEIPSFAVIIRCIHERGPVQAEALAELNSRGLWLSADQKISAGLIQQTEA